MYKMYVCESSRHNQTGIFHGLVSTMRKAKESKRGFSVFIGAGCSLSSSASSISTEKILEFCIRDNYDPSYCVSSWDSLYRNFVDNVWSRSGENDRQEMLSKYFVGLKPAKGYMCLRKLIEHGFITDIVTTNFDMLINDALHGLAYHTRVGDLPSRAILGGSNIKLYKVHGDIESGKLRFSPSELMELPESTAEYIRHSSVNSSLICGYSGQDQGLMKCLDKSSGYSVYWVSPRKPMKEDAYDNHHIYNWLSARRSEGNFIYGDDLGYFDNLMEKLCLVLLENHELTDSFTVWDKNTISEAIRINERVNSIFHSVLKCSDSLRSEYEWCIKFPFYAKNYETILNAYLYYYRESSNIPSGLLQVPENEIEALLMGVAIEIQAVTSGISTSPLEYMERLKTLFESKEPHYAPDTSFWDATRIIISSLESSTPIEENNNLVDIKLRMNNKGRMTLSVNQPKLGNIADTISLLSISGLFIPTCDSDKNIDRIGERKILMQKHGQEISLPSEVLCFKLNGVTKSELKDIFNAFFSHLQGYRIDEQDTIVGPNVKIFTEISNVMNPTEAFSLLDHLYHLSHSTTQNYLKLKSAFEIDSDTYIKGQLINEIELFLESDRLGMFVIGSSGSGKTKAIQHFIKTHISSKYTVAIATPKTTSFDNSLGLSVFWNNLGSHEESQLYHELDMLMESRSKTTVFIIDGLNEIDGDTDTCLEHYRKLVHSIDMLRRIGTKSIKVIITCRDYAFFDYCERSSLYPSVEICYCAINENSLVPYYQVQELNLEQQVQFVDLYFSDSNQRNLFEISLRNNPFVQQMYNQPYLIALAGRYYSSASHKTTIETLQDVFSSFAEQMLQRLGSYTSISIAKNIINIYFDLLFGSEYFGRRMTPFILLNRFPAGKDREQAAATLKSLCDINLFSSFHSKEYVRFTHDRIEEYFLCEYIFANSADSHVMNATATIGTHDPVFNAAIRNYFRRLIQQNLLTQFINTCDMLYDENMDILPSIVAESLESFELPTYSNLFAEAERSKLGIDSFISVLLEGIKQVITRDDARYPEKLICCYDELASIFIELKKHKKYFYYITSMFYLRQKGDLALAEKYCNLSLEETTEAEHLTRLIELHEAVIEKNKGNLDVAIDNFSQVFMYFNDNKYYDGAVQCVLEWGGTLRQKTKFEDAITVYSKIDPEHFNKFPTLRMKIHRKIGNAYKNIMQRQLNEYQSGDTFLVDAISDSYVNAQRELSAAMKISTGTVDIIEKMMILEEQAATAMHYSVIDSKPLARAKYILDDVEKMLALFPVPDMQIVHMRHVAIYKVCVGNLHDALEILRQAHSFAVGHANTYRLFEVNYQIGRLIEKNKELFEYQILHEGVTALNSALEKNLDENNQYRKNCKMSLYRLEKYLSSILE